MAAQRLRRRVRLAVDDGVEDVHVLLDEGIVLRHRHLDAEHVLADGERAAGAQKRAQKLAVRQASRRRTWRSYSSSFMAFAETFG